MFRYDKDMERVMQQKKKEIVFELQALKNRLEKELKDIVADGVPRLNKYVSIFDSVTGDFRVLLETMSKQSDLLNSDTKKQISEFVLTLDNFNKEYDKFSYDLHETVNQYKEDFNKHVNDILEIAETLESNINELENADWGESDTTKKSHILNRTHYKDIVRTYVNELTWDGSKDGKEIIIGEPESSFSALLGYIDIKNISDLYNKSAFTHTYTNGDIIKTFVTEDTVHKINDAVYVILPDSGAPLIIILNDTEENGINYSKGVWFSCSESCYISSFEVENKILYTELTNLKKLDKEFLPPLTWEELQNKPFGEKTIETLVYDKTIIESDYLSNSNYNVYQYNRSDLSILEEDKLYNVIWNGKKYENLQCMTMNNGSSTMLCIGELPNENGAFNFTEFPFLISVNIKFIEEDNYTLYQQQIYTNTKQEHSVQVYKLEDGIKTIDKKYLPTHLQFGEELGEVSILEIRDLYIENFSHPTSNLYTFEIPSDIIFNLDDVYSVNWNNTKYENLKASELDELVSITFDTNDYLVDIYGDGEKLKITLLVSNDYEITGTISGEIYKLETVTKTINKKYIPTKYIHIIHDDTTSIIKCNTTFDEIINMMDKGECFGMITISDSAYNTYRNNMIESIRLLTSDGYSVMDKEDTGFIDIFSSDYEYKIYPDNNIEFINHSDIS